MTDGQTALQDLTSTMRMKLKMIETASDPKQPIRLLKKKNIVANPMTLKLPR